MQYTISDIRRIAARVGEIARQIGVWDTTMVAVVLSEGSKSNGVAYRLNTMRQGSSAHYALPRWMGNDYLGMTKRDAYESLLDRKNVLYLLAEERSIPIDHDEVDRVIDLAESTGRADWSLWMDQAPWSN